MSRKAVYGDNDREFELHDGVVASLKKAVYDNFSRFVEEMHFASTTSDSKPGLN